MHANFPPFTRSADAAPESTFRPADGARGPIQHVAPKISEREAKLRTLKHYLYHAGLLCDELITAEQPVSEPRAEAPKFGYRGAFCGYTGESAA